MRINIQHKIAVIFIVISAIILLGIFSYLSNNLKNHTYNRIRDKVTKDISLCKSYLSDIPLNDLNSYNLDEIADRIGSDLDLRVTIIGFDGIVYGDSEVDGEALRRVENHLYRPEVQEALRAGIGESRRFSTTIQEDFLYIASVFTKNDSRGIIRLSIPLSEIEKLLNSLRETLGFAFLAAFILSVLVSYLASYFILRPLKEISWASQDIAHGNYSRKISLKSNDEIGYLASAFNYMSEQVKAHIEGVSESKSRLEAVFSSMFEGVMIVDVSGAILLMNEALKHVFRIEEDALGKRPIEVIRNLEIQEIVDNTLSSNGGLISQEISILLPEKRVSLVHATLIKKEGNTEGAVLVFHDVTDLRRLEKVRQDFVANVSHELRTPVSSIKGYAETLLDGALDDKKNAREFLKIILSDADRLATLIDDLLNLSKIESNKLAMETRPYKLLPLVERIISSLKGQMENKSIKVKINIPKDLPDVLIDETRIKQVLHNFIDNAIKYNHPNGEIAITAFDQDNFIRVDISDTGIGIPDKDLPRIFERFYRVDKARSRELGGTGLGLSIVKHIVQAHSGEVSVKSVEGQGSTFSFTLTKA